MMENHEEILIEMTDTEIYELKTMYSKIKEAYSAHVFLDLVLRWRKRQKRINIIVTSPRGSWRKDGSVIIFLDYRSKSAYLFSLDKTYKNIHEALLKTRRISYPEHMYFLNISEECVDVIIDAITKLKRQIIFKKDAILYIMDIEKAKSIKLEIPPNTYVKNLTKEHSSKINEVWPHKFQNSHEFLTVYIEQNGGYGLFKKDDDELIAWVIQGHLGHINLLHTEERHRGRGYGGVMLQIMAKQIAGSGCVPIGSVLVDNMASRRLFERIGFRVDTKTYYMFT